MVHYSLQKRSKSLTNQVKPFSKSSESLQLTKSESNSSNPYKNCPPNIGVKGKEARTPSKKAIPHKPQGQSFHDTDKQTNLHSLNKKKHSDEMKRRFANHLMSELNKYSGSNLFPKSVKRNREGDLSKEGSKKHNRCQTLRQERKHYAAMTTLVPSNSLNDELFIVTKREPEGEKRRRSDEAFIAKRHREKYESTTKHRFKKFASNSNPTLIGILKSVKAENEEMDRKRNEYRSKAHVRRMRCFNKTSNVREVHYDVSKSPVRKHMSTGKSKSTKRCSQRPQQLNLHSSSLQYVGDFNCNFSNMEHQNKENRKFLFWDPFEIRPNLSASSSSSDVSTRQIFSCNQKRREIRQLNESEDPKKSAHGNQNAKCISTMNFSRHDPFHESSKIQDDEKSAKSKETNLKKRPLILEKCQDRLTESDKCRNCNRFGCSSKLKVRPKHKTNEPSAFLKNKNYTDHTNAFRKNPLLNTEDSNLNSSAIERSRTKSNKKYRKDNGDVTTSVKQVKSVKKQVSSIDTYIQSSDTGLPTVPSTASVSSKAQTTWSMASMKSRDDWKRKCLHRLDSTHLRESSISMASLLPSSSTSLSISSETHETEESVPNLHIQTLTIPPRRDHKKFIPFEERPHGYRNVLTIPVNSVTKSTKHGNVACKSLNILSTKSCEKHRGEQGKYLLRIPVKRSKVGMTSTDRYMEHRALPISRKAMLRRVQSETDSHVNGVTIPARSKLQIKSIRHRTRPSREEKRYVQVLTIPAKSLDKQLAIEVEPERHVNALTIPITAKPDKTKYKNVDGQCRYSEVLTIPLNPKEQTFTIKIIPGETGAHKDNNIRTNGEKTYLQVLTIPPKPKILVVEESEPFESQTDASSTHIRSMPRMREHNKRNLEEDYYAPKRMAKIRPRYFRSQTLTRRLKKPGKFVSPKVQSDKMMEKDNNYYREKYKLTQRAHREHKSANRTNSAASANQSSQLQWNWSSINLKTKDLKPATVLKPTSSDSYPLNKKVLDFGHKSTPKTKHPPLSCLFQKSNDAKLPRKTSLPKNNKAERDYLRETRLLPSGSQKIEKYKQKSKAKHISGKNATVLQSKKRVSSEINLKKHSKECNTNLNANPGDESDWFTDSETEEFLEPEFEVRPDSDLSSRPLHGTTGKAEAVDVVIEPKHLPKSEDGNLDFFCTRSVERNLKDISNTCEAFSKLPCDKESLKHKHYLQFLNAPNTFINIQNNKLTATVCSQLNLGNKPDPKVKDNSLSITKTKSEAADRMNKRCSLETIREDQNISATKFFKSIKALNDLKMFPREQNTTYSYSNLPKPRLSVCSSLNNESKLTSVDVTGRHVPISSETNQCSNLKAKGLPQESDDHEQSPDVKMNMNRNNKVRTLTKRQKSRRKSSSQKIHSKKTTSKLRPETKSESSKTSSGSRRNLPHKMHAEPSTPTKIILVAKREMDEKCPHRTKTLVIEKSESLVSSQTSSTPEKAIKDKPSSKKQPALTSKTLLIRTSEDPTSSSSSRQTSSKTANPPKPSPKTPTTQHPYRSQPLGLSRSGSSASSPTPSAPSSSKLSLTKPTLESKETTRNIIVGDSKDKPRKPPCRHHHSGAQRKPISPLSSTSDHVNAKSNIPKKGVRTAKRTEVPKSPVQTQSTTKSLSSSSAPSSPSEKSSVSKQQLKTAQAFTKPTDEGEFEVATLSKKEATRLPYRTQTIGLSRSGSSRSSSPSGSNHMLSKTLIPSETTKGSPKAGSKPPVDTLVHSATKPKEMERPPSKIYVSKLVLPTLADVSKTKVAKKLRTTKLQGNALRQSLEHKKIIDQPMKIETIPRKADLNVLQPKTKKSKEKSDKDASQTVLSSVEVSGGPPKAANLPTPPAVDKKLRISGMTSALRIQDGQVPSQTQKTNLGKWDIVRSKLTNLDKKLVKPTGEKNTGGMPAAGKSYASKLNMISKARIQASTKDVVNAETTPEREAKPLQKLAETIRTSKLGESQNVLDVARVQPADVDKVPHVIPTILDNDKKNEIPEISNNSKLKLVKQILAEQKHQREVDAAAPSGDGTENQSALRIKYPTPRKLVDGERDAAADVPLEPPPRRKTKRHKIEKAAHHKATKKQIDPTKTPRLKSAAIKVIAAQKFLKMLPKSDELVVVKPEGDTCLVESILQAIPGYLIKGDTKHKTSKERKSHKIVSEKPRKQVQKGRSPCKKVERPHVDYVATVPSIVKRHAAPRHLEKENKCQKRALIECCLTDKQYEQLSKQRKDKLLETSKASKIPKPKPKVCEGRGSEIELVSQLGDPHPRVRKSHTITRKTAQIYNLSSDSASKLELKRIEHRVTTKRPKRRYSVEEKDKTSQRRCKISKSARAIKILQNNLQLLQHHLINNKQMGLSVEQLLRILCRNLESEPKSRDMEGGRAVILEVDWEDAKRLERRAVNRGYLETGIECNNSSTNCNAMNFNSQINPAQASKIPKPLSRFQTVPYSQANDQVIENSTIDFSQMPYSQEKYSPSPDGNDSKSECSDRFISDKDTEDTKSESEIQLLAGPRHHGFSLLCEECSKQDQEIMERKASIDQLDRSKEAKEETPSAEDQKQSNDPKQDTKTRKCFFKKKSDTSGRNCSSQIARFHEILSKDTKCNLKEQQKAKTPRIPLPTKQQLHICQSRTYMPPIVPVDRKVRRWICKHWHYAP